MGSIFYIQYNPDNYRLTQITSQDKSDNANWTPVAVSHSYQNYFKLNYENIKYDPSKQILIYPNDANRESSIVNDSNGLINNLVTQQASNTRDLNQLKYKVAWNHVMGIYSLPDDLPFLNKNYGIPVTSGSINIADYSQTGAYIVPAYTNLSAKNAPKGVDFNKGYLFKVYQLSQTCLIVTFINQSGKWVATFTPHEGLSGHWNKVISF